MLSKPDLIDIVAPDGSVRSRVDGYYNGKQFVIDDMKVDIRPGDEIRRMLPSGQEEVFSVKDPKFFGSGHFGSHYQVEISRPTVHRKHEGGHYNISMHGANARVNFSSNDYSTNTVGRGDVFVNLQAALDNGIDNAAERKTLQTLVSRIEAASDKGNYLSAYQAFIASAAAHMTIIAPFLPALADLASQF